MVSIKHASITSPKSSSRVQKFQRCKHTAPIFIHRPSLPVPLRFVLQTNQVIFQNCEKWAELSINRQASGKAANNDPLTNTLFDLILAPSTDYDPSPSTVPELVDEAFMFVIAGTDSSGNTMANALYYILSSPAVSSRLLTELQDNGITSQESFDCRLVQRLPYLVRFPHFPRKILHMEAPRVKFHSLTLGSRQRSSKKPCGYTL